MIKNKKILITGGGGFIGMALAERLAENNEIILLDKNFDNNLFASSSFKNNKNIQYAKVDILDIQGVSKIARNARIVIHTAAVLGVKKVMQNIISTLTVNFTGASNLLQVVSNNSSCERLIFFSTSEVYGVNAFKVSEGGDSVITSIQDTRWCYAISKLAGEHLALGYFHERGLPVVVVRPFNVFGPGRMGDHAILPFIYRALRGEDLKVFGDGTQIRAWCYISDFCDALMRCLEVKEAVGQAFNIGNPSNTLTVYDLARRIVYLCNSKSRIEFKSQDFADINIRVPDISKARRVLGFVPHVDMDEGLSRTMEWSREHADKLNSC